MERTYAGAVTPDHRLIDVGHRTGSSQRGESTVRTRCLSLGSRKSELRCGLTLEEVLPGPTDLRDLTETIHYANRAQSPSSGAGRAAARRSCPARRTGSANGPRGLPGSRSTPPWGTAEKRRSRPPHRRTSAGAVAEALEVESAAGCRLPGSPCQELTEAHPSAGAEN